MTIRLAALGAALALGVGVIAQDAPAPARGQDPPPPQQQQPPTFRAGTRTVPVWATVNDRDGSLVMHLTQDDFEVRDNGKVQAITQFTSAQQPLTSVLMIDGSGSMLPVFNAVMEAASAYVIRMLPEDKVRIGSFADLIRWGPEFTPDRDHLLAFLRNEFNIRMANDTRLWDAMREAILTVGAEPGRRAVVVLTDGWDSSSTASTSRILADARERDVVLYAVAMWTGRGSELQRPSRELERLATDSGGGFYELTEADEMNSTFSLIAQELHHQYIIGFAPKELDGKVHRLEVKVKPPGMKVKARQSYVADPPR